MCPKHDGCGAFILYSCPPDDLVVCIANKTSRLVNLGDRFIEKIAITSCATRLHPSHDGQTRGNPLQPCVCTYSYLGIYLGAEISFLEGRRRLNASYDAYALFFPSPALEPMYEGACRSNIGASERAYVLRSEHIWIAFKLSRLRKSCDMLHEAMPLHAFTPQRRA